MGVRLLLEGGAVMVAPGVLRECHYMGNHEEDGLSALSNRQCAPLLSTPGDEHAEEKLASWSAPTKSKRRAKVKP